MIAKIFRLFVVEDAEGRSVTAFIPAHEDQAPKFQTLEWTWRY